MDEGGFTPPLDASDPRFAGSEQAAPDRPRRLVDNRGPGASPFDPRVRRLRVLIPVAFCLALAGVAAMFFVGLDPGGFVEVVGPEQAVRRAVAERPRRVCARGEPPCAWLVLVDGELRALATSGPLPEEYGRQGVGWCASSGGFGAPVSGSRYDAAGNVVRGPAPRGLDRFRVSLDGQGRVLVDFSSLTTGLRAGRAELVPPSGRPCDEPPFDREADLDLGGG